MTMRQVEFHRAVSIGEIEDGGVSEVTIGENIIAVFRIGDDYFATAGLCTHAYARLAQGYVEGDVIECPYHGGTYDIRTGKALSAPCTRDLKLYPLRIEGDEILVGIETEDA
jgi:nitrite reductase/ring-hydroxylating ferredoxin subunit